MEEMVIDTPNLQRVLDEYSLRFEELVKTKMITPGRNGWNRVASGQLLASIHTRIDTLPGGIYEVYLQHLDYLKYIEFDTRPHFPPVKAIIKWVKDKRLPTRESTGNKALPTEKQLGFLVARKISKFGTKGTPIVANTQEELNAIYIPRLQEALLEDAENAIRGQMIHIELRFK